MTAPLSLTIHRSAAEIGGNCIEITAEGHRLLLDAGRPLDAPSDAVGLLPTTLDLARPVDGVLLSHPHQDHWGLVNELPPGWPIWSGRASERLIQLSAGIMGGEIRHAFSNWEAKRPIAIGPFTVTPFLTDHSAFDAYMLLIEIAGRRILYSGDFRLHGRKAVLPARFMAAPPVSLDALIMEGTNLGADKSHETETDLEGRFVDLFRRTTGRVFVAWSAQNVDRTVTLYRACLRSGRTLVVDLYTAEVLIALAEFGQLPHPKWGGIKVVITRRFRNLYASRGRGEFVEAMAALAGISASTLAATPEKWVCMIRPSLIADFAAKGVVPSPDDAWSYSQWRGYLGSEQGQKLSAWFADGGAAADHIHTSGHASPGDLKAFARAMNARNLIPVHGIAWDTLGADFENLRRLADGEMLQL